jgi:hypothetical protein
MQTFVAALFVALVLWQKMSSGWFRKDSSVVCRLSKIMPVRVDAYIKSCEEATISEEKRL